MQRSIPAAAILLILAAATAFVSDCDGAEMRVRAECSPAGEIVTLGDLVDLRCESTSEAERLADITLFPAPAPGLQRFVTVREIQDMLLIRGIDLIDHDFGGATTVRVVGREPVRKAPTNLRVAAASPRLAEQKLQKALDNYLLAASDEPWQVDFDLNPDAARWVSAAESLSVAGVQAPTSGRQCFEVNVLVGDQSKTIDVVADLSLPPMVVVPVRALPRETRISRADLELRRLNEVAVTAAAVRRIEDLVDKETTRTLAAGKPIDRSSVREPVLVRRGDIVTVIVRTAGIRVRTQGRARDAGAKGELVAIESLSDRRTYFAQVSGVREVEILAASVSANASSSTHSNRG